MSRRSAKPVKSAHDAVDRLEKLYAGASAALVAALDRYLTTRQPPSPEERAAFRYPLLRVTYRDLRPAAADAPARVRPSCSGPASTRRRSRIRARFRRYLLEQLEPLRRGVRRRDRGGASATRRSPIPMCWSAATSSPARSVTAAELARHFPTPQLSPSATRSPTASGSIAEASRGRWRCSMPRGSIISLRRLVHYTGSDWRHVQPWILLTNYHRYVDQFVALGLEQLRRRYRASSALVLPGNVDHRDEHGRTARPTRDRRRRAPGTATRCRPIT